ncbi:hypothetical protein [Actinoplanes sp. CA-252034]|uniref:hypothetical protein n=1 Tax=Actinoplanes sp. CA-252034 TaxID=3239906 RepID=UPI003D98E5D8
MTSTRGRWTSHRKKAWIAGATTLVLVVGGTIALTRGGSDQAGDAPAIAAPQQPVDVPAAIAQARSTGQPVEVSAENTETNTTYAHPDGTLTRDMAAKPVRARTYGRWAPIDPVLDHAGDSWTTRSTVSKITIPAAAEVATSPSPTTGTGGQGGGGPILTAEPDQPSRELVRMTTDEHSFALSWLDEFTGAAEVSGNRALYRNVLPEVDLLITTEADGFTQVLIVRSLAAAQSPELRELNYRLQSDTLRFSLADSGAIRGVDGAGTEIVAAPTPFMWDSAGTSTQESTSGFADGLTDLNTLVAVDGPLDGAREAIVGAAFAGDKLTLRPSAELLDAPETVYPVFIDPSFHGHSNAWTLVSKQHPTSAFWNGKGYNGGTKEARAGYESQTGQTQRSYFRINWDLNDVDLNSATFRIRETHSWSCTKTDVKLYRTDGISSSTTWNKQPTQRDLQDTIKVAYGYNSSCDDHEVAFDAMNAARTANTANPNWSDITFKIQAGSETDTKGWKKFTDDAVLSVGYNRKPTTPVDLQSLPLTSCAAKTPYPVVGITDLTFKAKATDPDSNLKAIHLTIWLQSNTNTKVVDADITVKKDATNATIGRIEHGVKGSSFTTGTYLWNTYAVDTENIKSANSVTCGITIDRSKPSPPRVTSVAFPDGDEGDDQNWKTPLGTAGTFTFSGGGADTTRYVYSFEAPGFTSSVSVDKTVASNDTVTTPGVTPPHAGPNLLYVKAEDKAKNQSNVTTYLFYVAPNNTLDGPGDTTGDKFPDLFALDQDNNLEMYASDGNGDINQPLSAAPNVPDGYWTGALLTHNGDYWAGDGLTDLIARLPDKKLWIYPGTGLGSIDVAKRIALTLPAGSPDPGTYTQVLSVGDIDGDRNPDLLVITGNELWALLGYTGARVSRAVKVSTEWSGRTLVTLGDHNNDGAADLVYRASTGALLLRNGRKAGAGTDLNSLATAAASGAGKDTAYSSTTWDSANIRLIAGTPNADTAGSPPDIWVVKTDDTVWYYPGGATAQGAGRKIALVTDGRDWTGTKALG